VASSALFRTESRAAHYRDDHPMTDPAWVATVAYADGRASRRALPLAAEEEAALVAPPSHAPRPDEFVE